MATAAPAQPAVSSSPSARPLRRGAIAALLAGVLMLLAAAIVGLSYWRAAALERQTEEGWSIVEATITGERTGWIVMQPDPGSPTGSKPIKHVQPQILVKYRLGDEELQSWVDIDANGPLSPAVPYHEQLAQAALEPFHRGQRILCSADADDPSKLQIADSDGGRRTLAMGCVLTAAGSLPGIGLVLAGWLLWRAGKASPSRSAATGC